MATARLPVILILVPNLLQVFVQAQQFCTCSSTKPNTSLSNLIASDPRIGALISKAQSQKQTASQDSKSGSKSSLFVIPQQNGIGLQQFLNSQHQQASKMPLNGQPLSMKVLPLLESQNLEQTQAVTKQQQTANQNFPQSLDLKQQSVNWQSMSQKQNLNLQPQKETATTRANLQPIPFQQQYSQSIPVNNLQVTGQQASLVSEIPLASLPKVKGNLQGLPSQVSEGVLLSNSGLSSSLSSILTNSCLNPTVGQVSFIIPQKNGAIYDVSTPVLDSTQKANVLLSVFPSYTSFKRDSNNLSQSNSIFIPLNQQNSLSLGNPSNLPLSFGLNEVISNQNLQTPSQVNIQSELPIQIQQPVSIQQPIQSQYVLTQPAQISVVADQTEKSLPIPKPTVNLLSPEPSNPTQPVISQQAVPQTVQAETSPSSQNQPVLQTEPQSLTAALIAQLQAPSLPIQYLTNPSHGSRSSMKILLPLLFNLLREKNGCCGCPPNCNCGCMNYNNIQDQQGYPFINRYNNNNFNHYTQSASSFEIEEEEDTNSNLYVDDDHPEPQVTDACADQIKYRLSQDKDISENCVESEEIDTTKLTSKKSHEKKKYSAEDYQFQNIEKHKNESAEYDDDYDESYENEE